MKNIKTFLLLFAIIAFFKTAVTAQETKADFAKVMIIPFDPNLYFSDSDDALSKQNNKTIKEIRTLFRYGLNTNVDVKILTRYSTRPLLTDTIKTAREDLNLIYRDITYFKDKSMVTEEMKRKIAEEEHEKKGVSFTKKDAESEAQGTSKLTNHVTTQEYMNVKFNPEMLHYLQKKYGTDIFVFINQFELVTNYEHCLDRATNTFERDIKVHFSIFDASGKQLAGDVAIAHFSSNTNDLTEIMRNNFPIISEYLAGNLPNNAKPAEKEEVVEKNAPTTPTKVVKNENMEFEGGN